MMEKTMTSLTRSVSNLAALLTLLAATPTLSQDVPDIVGDWHGAAAVPTGDQMMILSVKRGDDGTLTGDFENRDLAPGRKAPVSELTVTTGRLTFKLDQIRATYEATWDEAARAWRGAISRGSIPLAFSRGLPPQKPRIEGLDGRWEAIVESNGVRLRQVLRISTGDWGTNLVMDSPDQYVANIVGTGLSRSGRLVRYAIGRGGEFEGVLSEGGDELSGVIKGNGQQAPLAFTRTQTVADQLPPNRPQNPKEPVPYLQEEVSFDNPAAPGIRLAGTLTLPQGKGPFPAAILISGTGQHDRDETLDGHKPFLVIADHLTRHGIAVLRFDDRGAGKSAGDATHATAGDKASDANAAFAFLAGREIVRPDAIGFIGHSEGGLVGPIAMAENDKVAFLVSLAGPATPMMDLMLSQRRIMLGSEGLTEDRERQSRPVFIALTKALTASKTIEEGYAAAAALMTPRNKALLGLPPETDDALILREWTRERTWYLAHVDPASNLRRIKVPVLAMNGSLDRQTEPELHLAAWRKGLKNSRDVTITELPGINHMFQTAKTGRRGEYRDIEETMSPTVLTLLSDWISRRFVTR